MDVPDLVRERLGDEEILAGVNLGDDDAVCLTATRTLVYRSEGLLSEESVAVLPHDVERIDVKDGRRKTTFSLTYVDSQESFTVPGDRAETVLELVMAGVLRVAEVADPDESVRGVYRFSELTLIVTDRRLVKHVGSHLWDADYEEYPFADVTGLAFEEGSVATQIVISVDGRPERIKAPNDDVPELQRTLKHAIFEFHGVDSMAELAEAVGVEPETDAADSTDASSDLTLDSGIDPLVTGSDERSTDVEAGARKAEKPEEAASAGSPEGRAVAADETTPTEPASETVAEPVGESVAEPGDGAGQSAAGDAVTPDDVERIDERLEKLTTAVKRQNELLRKQHDALQQLVGELRRDR